MLTLFVVSDATGDTAQQMVQAALAQFKDAPVRLVRHAHVRTADQVRNLVREACAGSSIITMLYLAYRGWFAANVPLVPETPLPKTLLDMPADRVFCLVMTPERLKLLRRVRAEEESIPLEPYASLDQIHTELSYMEDLCRKHQWQRIDTTGKSVEEVAREIIEWLEE
jgi:regulator of PEP synthase PpsR (kinase-PPPase family)